MLLFIGGSGGALVKRQSWSKGSQDEEQEALRKSLQVKGTMSFKAVVWGELGTDRVSSCEQ